MGTSFSKFHLVGLLGPGGVHSHDRHLYALLRLLKKNRINPILHLITDGRDTPPKSAAGYIAQLARLTRGSSNTEVLKLSLIDAATDKTIAYTWTSPDADRIGLNMKWIQVGLTLEAETPHLGFDTPPKKEEKSAKAAVAANDPKKEETSPKTDGEKATEAPNPSAN